MQDVQRALDQAIYDRHVAQERINDIVKALPKEAICPEHHKPMMLQMRQGRIEYVHYRGGKRCVKRASSLALGLTSAT